MAWIKVELITPDKPEVVCMAAALRLDQDAVFGKLFRIWAWADQNSVDGEAMPITEAFIDRLTAKRGFASAMRKVGWLFGEDGSLTFPNFDRHNGNTAKGRAMENRKKGRQRAGQQAPEEREECPESVPIPSGQHRDKEGGPDKIRDIIHNTPLPPLPKSEGGPSAEGKGETDGLRRAAALPFPSVLGETFRPHWQRWIAHVSNAFHYGREVPIGTVEQHLRDCAERGETKAIAAIEHTIALGTYKRLIDPPPLKANAEKKPESPRSKPAF